MSWISSIQAIHPLALYFVQKTTIILLLAFTSPSSLLRHAPFPVLLSVSFALLPHYSLHVKEPENILAVAGEVLMGHMEYLEKLLLSQWSFEDYGPIAEIRRTPKLRDRLEKNPHAKGSPPAGLLPRLRFAFWAGTSQRYIKTPHQTLHTPPYSASHPAYIPSRTVFLVRKALIVLSCILLLDVVALSGLTPKDPAAYSHENSGLFPRLWRGDWSDQWGVTRMRSTFGFWTENGVGIQAYYSTLTALGVALHFSSPADRRPVFGSVAKACTLRGYWGHFWHLLLRKKLTKPVRYVMFTLLRLPRSSDPQPQPLRLFVRYLQVFLTFLLSGLFHQGMDQAQGIPFGNLGAVEFFVMMAVGICVEDFVKWIYGRLRGNEEDEGQGVGWPVKVLGYVWVFLFFSWTTPLWSYSRLRRMGKGERNTEEVLGVVSWVGRFLRPAEESVPI